MRRTLPVVITIVTGIIMIIRDIFDIPEITSWVTTYIVMSVTLSTNTAYAIGIMNLFKIHGLRVARRRSDWQFSVILLCSAGWMLLMGLFLFDANHNAPVYNWFYQMLPVQLGNATFAVICFYIASAAYRAFRMRSIESTLLLLSACFVMLGGVSIGYALWDQFPQVKVFIMNNLNTAAVRGITLGITLGSLAQYMRNLLGIERGYMAE